MGPSVYSAVLPYCGLSEQLLKVLIACSAVLFLLKTQDLLVAATVALLMLHLAVLIAIYL